MSAVELYTGTRIFYHGDMANMTGHGTIKKVIPGRFGTQYEINMDDGREFTTTPAMFSPKYLGHGGTRFVTEAAYNEWREEKIAGFREFADRVANL